MALPFGYGEFDIAACHRVLHHLRRPELAVSELARVTRLGGRVFIADQLGSVDPLRSLEMDRFERLRDASHQRLLPDGDIRGYLDANDLVLLTSEVTRERVDLEQRLDLAGVSEEDRSKIRGPAPAAPYEVEIGWYVARKPGPS
jgi:SAM-dependent methyltransferase